MFRRLFRKRGTGGEVDPEEIFLDSKNLPQFDTDQFEGQIEKPITPRTILLVGAICTLILCSFAYRAWALQITDGERYAKRSENNHLRHSTIFADRGNIYDRNEVALAWNEINPESTDHSLRKYISKPGFAHVLGYVRYPLKDSAGNYYQETLDPKDGVERLYNKLLSGKDGVKIVEINALGKKESEGVLDRPQSGKNLVLSIDADLQTEMHAAIKRMAAQAGFQGGAGGLIDLKTGEMLVLTSYPEYDPNIMTDASDSKTIQSYVKSTRNPFVDRFVDGVYTPGSTVKPFLAIGALQEKIIDANKKILSTGSISVPNPYDPTKKSVFVDWRPQGWVDMRKAIAVSSNVYFYEIGGGFEDQKGLGITRVEKYLRLFGFGEKLSSEFFAGKPGVIPNPAWKAENFKDGTWRLGDTYHTSIGQYGVQVTPIQLLIAVSTIANSGVVPVPVLLKGENEGKSFEKLPIDSDKYFTVVQEGMRMGVVEGTASVLNVPGLNMAGKTGTAELGADRKLVNSWVMGFFPYQKPRYAFVVLMERGSRDNKVGAVHAALDFFKTVYPNHTDMFTAEAPTE
jgi:penicillin-binding protein 2